MLILLANVQCLVQIDFHFLGLLAENEAMSKAVTYSSAGCFNTLFFEILFFRTFHEHRQRGAPGKALQTERAGTGKEVEYSGARHAIAQDREDRLAVGVRRRPRGTASGRGDPATPPRASGDSNHGPVRPPRHAPAGGASPAVQTAGHPAEVSNRRNLLRRRTLRRFYTSPSLSGADTTGGEKTVERAASIPAHE